MKEASRFCPFFAALAKKPDQQVELQTDAEVPCKRLPDAAYRTLYTLVEQKTQMPPNPGTKQFRIRVENTTKEKMIRLILHIELVTDGKAESLADIVTGNRDVSGS